jgi:Ni/Co efflux regulator RcnB
MRIAILAALALATALPTVPAAADDDRRGKHDNRRDKHENRGNKQNRQQDYRNYDYNRPDPRYGSYQANRYYVDNSRYQTRRLGPNDRVYRGQDNRYYCRRSDGTTGLIIGGLGGGVLGNLIAPNGSKTLGSLIGGGLGAVLGNSIDRNNVTCR